MEWLEARSDVRVCDRKVKAEDRVCERVASLRSNEGVVEVADKQGVVSEVGWWVWAVAVWIRFVRVEVRWVKRGCRVGEASSGSG
jgi:hypothetical protein